MMRLYGRLVPMMAAALVAISLASPLAAERTQSTTFTSAAVDLASIRIDNFGQVNTTYYRGAQPRGTDYADLAALGVKTVIDLQQDGDIFEKQLVEGANMAFHRIPMTTRVPPTEAQLAEFFQIVSAPVNQPVYVHCAGGRHRTGVMTAAYRMTFDRWTADRAFAEMKRYRFGADFLHPEFKRFVFAFSPQVLAPATVKATAGTK